MLLVPDSAALPLAFNRSLLLVPSSKYRFEPWPPLPRERLPLTEKVFSELSGGRAWRPGDAAVARTDARIAAHDHTG